jgi:site-specific DNA-cytosine methylase
MGYSVRLGVINAGNFGVSQSRTRTFILAAAPRERLPEWHPVRHVFTSPQLTINVPSGFRYTTAPQNLRGGAQLRAVTVEDAIGDLISKGLFFLQGRGAPFFLTRSRSRKKTKQKVLGRAQDDQQRKWRGIRGVQGDRKPDLDY